MPRCGGQSLDPELYNPAMREYKTLDVVQSLGVNVPLRTLPTPLHNPALIAATPDLVRMQPIREPAVSSSFILGEWYQSS